MGWMIMGTKKFVKIKKSLDQEGFRSALDRMT